jgi:hypothetical protein
MADQQTPYSAFSDTFDNIPTAMVYETFAETASAVSSHYMRLSDTADTAQDRDAAWAKVLELRDLKYSVPADDRAALIEHIQQWRADLKALEARNGG